VAIIDILKSLNTLQSMFQECIENLEEIIGSYGEVVALHNNVYVREELIHDYIFLCLTKGTRTCKSIELLLHEGLAEDSKILARAAYETYINGIFAYSKPDTIDLLVAIKLGLHVGRFEHPKSKKGKFIRNKVNFTSSDDAVDLPLLTIKKMASNSALSADANVHDPLYSFLSEFTHVHIVSSGSYRTMDDRRYTVESRGDVIFHTMFICTYVAWLLLDLATRYLELRSIKMDYEKVTLKGVADFLLKELHELTIEESLSSLRVDMESRLKAT